MDIAIDYTGNIAIAILLVDELDASNTGEFKRAMAPALETSTRLVMDLGRLRFVDSSGLGAFLSCLRTMSRRGSVLKLCGMSPQVRAVFELVRLHRIFEIYDTIEDAVQAFGSATYAAQEAMTS